MAPIVLGYWDIRGLAQPIRLLLEYSGLEWEDKLYSCGPAPTYDRSSWMNVKESIGVPFPNLPYMIDGDVKLSQTQAILRYVARKAGLMGKNEQEMMHADLVTAEWADFMPGLTGMCYSPEFETRKPVYLSALPAKLKKFSDFLGSKKFFAGENVTFADFVMYEALDQHNIVYPGCLKDYPNLEQFHARIESLDQISKYLKSNRFIKYPLNNKSATFGG